jgi:hypothetical protein
MPAALMKGGKWSVGQDPDHLDRVQIEVTGVEGLPAAAPGANPFYRRASLECD